MTILGKPVFACLLKGLTSGLVLLVASLHAGAQIGGPYVDVPDTPRPKIDDSVSCTTPAYLIRTINVPESFIITDLDVGFLANHTWRTDINLILISPAGTDVALLTGPYEAGYSNYNVRFDDESLTLVDTGSHAADDELVGEPTVVRPEGGTLSSFDGEDAQGVWTFQICDVDPFADTGSLHQIELFFSEGARLSAGKTISVFDPAASGLYALPGNDVIYTITVTNVGGGGTDSDTVALIDALPFEVEFYNNDIDNSGPELNPVSFTQTGTPGLTFAFASDTAFSNAVTKPENFAACNYTPATGYDPAVTFICFNPKGVLAAGAPDPSFSISFRARIK